MAEANIKLANGTTISVSGSPEEIARIVALYNDASSGAARTSRQTGRKGGPVSESDNVQRLELDISNVLNTINDCQEAEAIEQYVLDKADVVNRVLMPLYINDRYFDSKPYMTTGEISKILGQLGTPISTPNVSAAISRKAKSYVMGDSVRTRGATVRYAINRRGLKYFEGVLAGEGVSAERVASPQKSRPKAKSKSSDKSGGGGESKKPKSSGYRPKFNSGLDLLKLEGFFKNYVLNNNSEFVVTFTKFLRDEVGLDDISGDDIYTCFVELKALIKLPGSFMNTLRNAQNRDHYILYESGFTKIALTARGENLFNHDIVDRKVS